MARKLRDALAVSLCAAAVSVSAVRVLAGDQGQSPPRFVSGIDLVPVDFLVLGSDGAPVTDLTLGEVTVRIDGRARKLRSLQWVQVDEVRPPGQSVRAAVLPPPFGTNAVTDAGRGMLIALEDESLRPGREAPLRAAVHRLLASLGPRDRVALTTMPYGGLKVDFTREHDRVSQAFAQIAGRADSRETGRDAACRTRETLEALGGVLSGLSSPDGPTTIVFITSGLAGPRRDAPVMLAPGICELTTDDFHRVGVMAAAARANFYVVQPEDPTLTGVLQTENIAGYGFTGSDNPMEGIEHISGVTGARRLHLATQGAATLLRITRETAGYYLAAFEPERGDRNGEKHGVAVGVARPGLDVRVRPGMIIPRTDRKRTAPTPRSMLREARIHRDLPMRTIGYTSSGTGGNLKVVILAEPVDPAVTFRSAIAGLFDSDGKLVAQATVESLPAPGFPLITGLEARPGAYRLRVAASDTDGRTGTADYRLTNELAPAGPLSLSSMMLGVSRPAGILPRLQFGEEPVALGYLEIYGATEGAPVSVTFEVATTTDGPGFLKVPGAVTETRNPMRRTATGALAIGTLAPGDYVVRAVVQMQGQPAGRVVQTLRKLPASGLQLPAPRSR